MGLGSTIAGALLGGVFFAVTVWVWQHRIFTIPMTAVWAWVVLFFAEDLTYYWFHRIAHERRFWWASHVNHHTSTHYNLSTALRQTWTGGVAGTWLLWLPLTFLGFPPAMVAIQKGISLVYQFWIHTEVIKRMPRWFEAVFNTPSHHRVHHARNARYLDANYAGILIIWDRMFGTFIPETDEEPCRYGTVKNLNRQFQSAVEQVAAQCVRPAGSSTRVDRHWQGPGGRAGSQVAARGLGLLRPAFGPPGRMEPVDGSRDTSSHTLPNEGHQWRARMAARCRCRAARRPRAHGQGRRL
jgi:sterol desaturase/sphingolipid hydroxylase (fatty acid hydroxylase superfamily)